ncbi:MAG: glycosyltransferase family 39 protein [Anaerolineales bacterium]|jgi:hypothetical protein
MRLINLKARPFGFPLSGLLPMVQRRELGFGLLLAVATLVTRLPWLSRYFYQWDSINFSLALDKFDVAAGQPQVPGYILYVVIGRLARGLLGNAHWGLVSISLVASVLAVMVLLRLGTEMFDRRVGVIASVLLATSPLFWFYGELALPHALDEFVVLIAVWWLFKLVQGEVQWAVPAAVWLALAGGLRPQTEAFLFPLAIYAAVRLPRKQLIVSLGVLVLANFLWLAPLTALSGGISRYLTVAAAYAQSFNQTSSVLDGAGWAGLSRNVTKLFLYTAYGLAGAGLVAALAAFQASVARPTAWPPLRKLASREQLRLLVLWAAPSIAYYVLIHMGQQGLVFVFLPALLLIVSRLLDFAVSSERWIRGMVALAVAANAFIFIGLPTYPLANQRVKLLTSNTLRQNDEYLGGRIQTIRNNFSAEDTLIVSSEWRFVQYYLPQYAFVPFVLGARWESDEGQPAQISEEAVSFKDLGIVPNSRKSIHVVLFEPALSNFSKFDTPERTMILPDGGTLTYFDVDGSQSLVLNHGGFGTAESGAGE